VNPNYYGVKRFPSPPLSPSSSSPYHNNQNNHSNYNNNHYNYSSNYRNNLSNDEVEETVSLGSGTGSNFWRTRREDDRREHRETQVDPDMNDEEDTPDNPNESTKESTKLSTRDSIFLGMGGRVLAPSPPDIRHHPLNISMFT